MSGRKPFTQQELQNSFNAKFIPEPTTGCWLWTAGTFEHGYGKIKYKRKNIQAHRLSWILFKNEHPGKLFVCHKCDTPSCVNPDHLFLGTALDNNLDCVKKKRKFNQRKTHCSNGHPLNGLNLYLTPAGVRQCVTCKKKNYLKWRKSPKGIKWRASRTS